MARATSRYTPRGDLSKLLESQTGRCNKCHEPMELFHIDHVLPLALGGADDLANKQLLCPACHGVKTHGTGATTAGTDIGNIRKQRKRERPRRPKTKWPSRSFPKRLKPWG